MRKTHLSALLLLICCLSLVGCKGSEQMSQNEFEARIEHVESTNLENSYLATGWYHTNGDSEQFDRVFIHDGATFRINPRPILLKENIEEVDLAESEVEPGAQFLWMQFDELGTAAWREGTREAIDQEIVMIIDNNIVTHGVVVAEIVTGHSRIYHKKYSNGDMMGFKKVLSQ